MSGLAGSAAVTVVHEVGKRVTGKAPRMDVLGRKFIEHGLEAVGIEPPRRNVMQGVALVGDLVSNGLYYSGVGLGEKKHAVRNGLLLGVAGGVAAVALPGVLGLPTKASRRTWETMGMTVLWYVVGGVVAGVVYQGMGEG